jgi:hypothetical protein
VIIAIAAGAIAGIGVRRIFHARKMRREESLREIERQAIEESKRAEKRERHAARRAQKKSRQG